MAACIAPQLFRNRQTRQYWAGPCGRWHCPACGQMLARRWRAILQWATDHGQPPQYLLTLTVRNPLPLWRQAPPAQREEKKAEAAALCQMLTRALTRLVAEIRAAFGPFEYVAFVELTTGRRTPGHRPHLHLLVRGPQLPQRWLSRRWAFHTRGSFKVDWQRLRSPSHAACYLVGYTIGQRKKAQPGLLPRSGGCDPNRPHPDLAGCQWSRTAGWRLGVDRSARLPLVGPLADGAVRHGSPDHRWKPARQLPQGARATARETIRRRECRAGPVQAYVSAQKTPRLLKSQRSGFSA